MERLNWRTSRRSSVLATGASWACLLLLLLLALGAQTAVGKSGAWPQYSQQRMPDTAFTCRGKILGGYYADPETQCQMFHVCVKVSGVGVQDFRFLCPNGTAFDQEAQTCADWGDVDCEQATLYYGGDNFDLYRLGSGFESKRSGGGAIDLAVSSPIAASRNNVQQQRNGGTSSTNDEEPTFHLQQAESNDARRSKLTFVGHQQQPQSQSVASSSSSAGDKSPYKATGSHNYQPQKSTVVKPSATFTAPAVPAAPAAFAPKPATNFVQRYNAPAASISTSTSTSTSTTTTTTTVRPVYTRPSTVRPTTTISTAKSVAFVAAHNNQHFEFDDIFKGSHSSNFFNNRHGKDDADFDDALKSAFKPLPSTTTSRNSLPNGRSRSTNRGRVHYKPDAEFGDLETRSRQRSSTSTSTTSRPASTTTTVAALHQRISNYQPKAANKADHFNFQPFETSSTTKAPFRHQQQPSFVAAVTTERAATPVTRQDPFKVTNNAAFLNRQADNFNFELNGAFESQSNAVRPFHQALAYTTSSRPTTASPTTTTGAPLPPLKQAPTNDEFIDVFKVKPNRAGPGHTINAFGIFGLNITTVRPVSAQELYAAALSGAEPTKLQRDNFHNLERTVQQLQHSVNRVFGSDTRTLLNAFTPATPTTYNPHQYTPRPTTTSTSTSTTTTTTTPRPTPAPVTLSPLITSSPRGFAATAGAAANSIQPVQQPGRFPSRSENYTPSSVKRFSTLVPRDQYNPTTFKPTPIDGSKLFLQEAQHIVNRNTKGHRSQHPSENTKYLHTVNFAQPGAPLTTFAPHFVPITTSSSTTTTTVRPISASSRAPAVVPTTGSTTTAAPTTTTVDGDEDDGQYHPELYEQDFAKNKLKRLREQKQLELQQQQKLTSQFQASASLRAQQNSNNIVIHQQPRPFHHAGGGNSHPSHNQLLNSAEDELLNTAHSQNIAASRNELQRAIIAQQQLAGNAAKKAGAKAPTISPKATKAPAQKTAAAASDDKQDYDYAYYDSANDNPPEKEYTEFGFISDFGRTAASQHKRN